MSCIQQLIGNHGLGFHPDHRNHSHNEQLAPPGLLALHEQNHEDILTTHETLWWHREDALALE